MAKREWGICENCQEDASLEIHHKDNDHKNNSGDNLIKLCKHCHGRIHGLESSDNESGERLGTLTTDISKHRIGTRLVSAFKLYEDSEVLGNYKYY